jgi:(S)-2-hydroxyglutarate dehydrogenase
LIYDFCVVGGGIVGMATAMTLLQQRPGAAITVLEKESSLARHQSGHNSGVIHSGIYYETRSLKAELCRRGVKATKEFCAEHGIPVVNCGKLIVATNDLEAARLAALAERATVNNVGAQPLSRSELRALEPHVEGVGALLVPSAGIVDYPRVTEAMAQVVRSAGGRIECGVEVSCIVESAAQVRVMAGAQEWMCRQLVVCGGLQADRLARAAGLQPKFQIVPFRGEYYHLPPGKSEIVQHLIYPVPDPALPFLGVHLTRTIAGGITVGPNAVLGLSREGYRRGSVRVQDIREYAMYPGLWKLARAHAKAGALEMRNSIWKPGFLREVRKYCPSLRAEDLLPHEAGIRAQAVLRDGTMVQDFLMEDTRRTLHVYNAPSPAATSAIPIAAQIAGRVLDRADAA